MQELDFFSENAAVKPFCGSDLEYDYMNWPQKLKGTIVFVLKLLLFVSLFFIFFGIFSIKNPWLLAVEPYGLNRTMGVTMLTFAVLGISLMSVYGGYAVGKQKSKPIVYSMTLATIITDLFTHLVLSIMNAGESANKRFVYETPYLLLVVIILQIFAIIAFTYLGNYIYFSIEPPEKCCVIAASEESLSEFIPQVKLYKMQYSIESILYYDLPNIYDYINKSDTVFLYDVPFDKRTEYIEYCYKNNKNIYYDFEISDVVSANAKFATIDDKSLISHVVKDLTFEQRVIKRLMDIFFSLLAAIITSPLMLGAIIAIKLDDGGKIIYKQKRLTKFGREFEVFKFRTMKEENQIDKSVTADDDRITKVGRVLRKYRIDELPQLFNILNGEMSIVGPRPEMLKNVEKYTDELPEFSYRLRAKAGLTGLAQISGKYNTSPKDKLILDLMYIERFSIWQDWKIIFQTFTVLFKADESTEAFKEKSKCSFDAGCGPEAAGTAGLADDVNIVFGEDITDEDKA